MEQLKCDVDREMQRRRSARSMSEFFVAQIREVGTDGALSSDVTELTVWRPTADVFGAVFAEGNYVDIFGVNTQQRFSAVSNIPLLSGNSRSKYVQIDERAMGISEAVRASNHA